MAKTGDRLLDSYETEIRKLKAKKEFLEARLLQLEGPLGPLSPPRGYSIEVEKNGRASAFFGSEGICSTVSEMDALRWCWCHYLGISSNDQYFRPDGSNVHIDWRQLKSGWVWWYSQRVGIGKPWIASEDFTSIEACLQAAYQLHPKPMYKVGDRFIVKESLDQYAGVLVKESLDQYAGVYAGSSWVVLEIRGTDYGAGRINDESAGTLFWISESGMRVCP